MITLEFSWKEYKIDLVYWEAYLRANFPKYVGNQAAGTIQLIFSEELTAAELERIQAGYDDLKEYDELLKTDATTARDSALQQATAKLASLSWNQMTIAERKIVLKQDLDAGDLDALVVKYPMEIK